MHLLCLHCQHPITVPDGMAGKSVECPLCGKSFVAPTLSTSAPVPPPTPPAKHKHVWHASRRMTSCG